MSNLTIYGFVQQSIGSLQKKYSIGSFELLSKTAPIQATSLIVLGPFIDYVLGGISVTSYKMSSGAFVSLLSKIPHFLPTIAIQSYTGLNICSCSYFYRAC